MTIWESIILGAVEGLTEFIPVSSTGHLIIARAILGDGQTGGLTFDAIIQCASILAVAVYFWKDIRQLVVTFWKIIRRKEVEMQHRILFWAVVLGSIPAGIAGLLLESTMETAFRSVTLVAISLVAGSILMLFAELRAKKLGTQTQTQGIDSLTVQKGFRIGLFQILALVPGISRSGATISGGLILGMTREAAARFSFILAFPLILAAGLKKLADLISTGGFATLNAELVTGSVVAFIVGLASIHFLIRFLRTRNLYPFIWYRIILAVFLLIFFV